MHGLLLLKRLPGCRVRGEGLSTVIVFVFRDPDPADFVEDIVRWIRGKNVFLEEDCKILNFGFVVV